MSYRTYWRALALMLSIGTLFAAGLFGRGTVVAASSSVTIQDFAFMPAGVTISAGDTVTWTNQHNGVMHTVTADDGSFDSGPLSTGQRFSMTFPTAGTVAYHCTIHPNIPTMHGSVTIAGAAATATRAAPAPATSTGRPSSTAAAVTAPTQPPAARPAASAPARASTAQVAAPVSQRPPARQSPATQAPAARVALPNTGAGGSAGDRDTPLVPLGIGTVGVGLAAFGLIRLRRCR